MHKRTRIVGTCLTGAISSVRPLADEAGEITLRRGYKPFDELDRSAGDGVTHFGFTGEWGEGFVLDGGTCGLPNSLLATYKRNRSTRTKVSSCEHLSRVTPDPV